MICQFGDKITLMYVFNHIIQSQFLKYGTDLTLSIHVVKH